jgi:hypothetical protein
MQIKHLRLSKDERNFMNASAYLPNHAHLHHKLNSKLRNKRNYNELKPDFGKKRPFSGTFTYF